VECGVSDWKSGRVDKCGEVQEEWKGQDEAFNSVSTLFCGSGGES
jgi:hypothetical protein